MKLSNLLIRIALIVAIFVSIVLSWMIWTNNSRYERNTSSNVATTDTTTADKGMGSVFLPTQVFKVSNNQKYLTYNKTENLVSVFQKQIATWEVNQPGRAKSYRADDYLDFIKQNNTIQLVYPDEITYDIFDSIFKQSGVSKRNNFNFNRLVFSSAKSPNALYFLDDVTYTVRKARLHKADLTKIHKLLNSATLNLAVSDKLFNDKPLLYFDNTVKITPYSYLISKQSENYYVSTLLNNSDPGSVEAKDSGNTTVYKDGRSRTMSINHSTGLLSYDNYSGTKINDNTSELLSQSYDELSRIGNPLTNMRYFSYDDKNRTVIYRSYVEGFPIFYQTQYGSALIQLMTNGQQHMDFSSYSLQVPVPSTQASESLPSTEDILNQMQNAGYDLKKIDSIQLGYTWLKDTSNDEIIDLQPSYYVSYDGQWQEYKVWITKNREMGAGQ